LWRNRIACRPSKGYLFLMGDPVPPRASQSFVEKAGDAWVRMQDRTDAMIDPLGRIAMERLGVVAGERILDVGCGCGQTLLELAELVGPSGHVLGVDISPQMLGRARERVADRPTIALAVGDAQTYAFAPEAFDAVYSRFGVMFFEDAVAAFANLRRALVPGGRLAFVCWQDIARNPWADVPLRAVLGVLGRDAAPELVRPGNPGPFYFSDPDRVRTILTAAGFTDVVIDPYERPMNLGAAATVEEALAYSRHIGPAARAMADADPNLRPALDAALTAALARFTTDRGVWSEAAAFIVTARAPT
jgi:ubiquinone/menaquinone biosynthesis C-methylase UbiE